MTRLLRLALCGALLLFAACGAATDGGAVCGDQSVHADEVCDDGNTIDGDGCSASCDSDESCGNGVVDSITGEGCDDGNTSDGDGCRANCSLPSCGDGILDDGELCDDGNATDGDGCSSTCMSDESCGNGVVDTAAGEACDDGNLVAGDGCSADCASDESCGNGTLDAAAGEICDDGNTVAADGCAANCLSDESCGNGTVDTAAGEVCDDGNVTDADGCAASCLSDESCGNGVLDMAVGEICDDGNLVDGDGCAANCLSDESCGNGTVDTAAGEVCDDGNVADGDGCAASCLSDESCGNGVLDMAVGEACDDGNLVDADGCAANCLSNETCGNGVVDTSVGETCDDGNSQPGDGCDGMCVTEYCARVINTTGEDMVDPNWLDGCVDAVGQTVEVTVRDENGMILYQQSGTKNGGWLNYNNITSTAAADLQYEKNNHNAAITLGNGDLLNLPGKASDNSGCGGSLGNGYGLVIHAPLSSTYYDTIKVLLQPYRHTVGLRAGNPRSFGDWTAAKELSFAGGAVMHSCFPLFGSGPGLSGVLGSLELAVY